MFDRLRNIIGKQDMLKIGRADRLLVDQRLKITHQFFMVFHTHDHHGKVFHLAGLDERYDFHKFIQGPEASGHNDKTGGVFS